MCDSAPWVASAATILRAVQFPTLGGARSARSSTLDWRQYSEREVISGGIVKTFADDGIILGVGTDLTLNELDLDEHENAPRTLLITAIGTVAASR